MVIDDKYVDVSLDSVSSLIKGFLAGDKSYKKDYYITEHIKKKYLPFGDYLRTAAQTKLRNEFRLELEFYDDGIKKLYNLE